MSDQESRDAWAYAEEQVKDMEPGEEREEMRAFYAFQYGGLLLIGEGIRRRGKRRRDHGRGTA